MFFELFIVVNKYYNDNKYRNALLRIDYPKALDEQQKENESAKHERDKKQSMERRRERHDEEVLWLLVARVTLYFTCFYHLNKIK